MHTTDIIRLLDEQKIALENWGRNGALGFRELMEDLDSGAVSLEARAGRLIRVVRGIEVHCLHRCESGDLLKLLEWSVTDPDRRPRWATIPSIWMRLRPSVDPETHARALEHPVMAMLDAMETELGFREIALSTLECPLPIERVRDPVESASFPGLYTERKAAVFVIMLESGHYDPDGYHSAIGLVGGNAARRPRERMRRRYRWVPIGSEAENA